MFQSLAGDTAGLGSNNMGGKLTVSGLGRWEAARQAASLQGQGLHFVRDSSRELCSERGRMVGEA
jgi:hypothetical protein